MFLTVLACLGLLWLAWVIQAWLSAWQWRKFVGRLYHTPQKSNSPEARPPACYQPLAAIVVPFKGLDLDLPAAIQSLCTLNYPQYELLLVVDSKEDPAYGVLVETLAKYPQIRSQILVAGFAGMYEGQKIHNQLLAIDQLIKQRQTLGEDHVAKAWVFADSDAIPGPDWLQDMVYALYRKDVGMTTGYRWLVPTRKTDPQTGKSTTSFWASIASVINTSGMGFLGKDKYNHAWGGSMALLATTAIQGDLRSHLDGALCDDYQFSKMVRSLGKRIYFVCTCLVATPAEFDWKSLVNFAHRQYLLTRVYAPRLYLGALLLVSFYVLANLSAWAGLIWLLVRDPAKWQFWGIPLLAILAAAAANQIRSNQRKAAAKWALGNEVVERLRLPLLLDRWFTWFWTAVNLVLILRAARGRTMVWRGIFYRLRGPQKVERMNRS